MKMNWIKIKQRRTSLQAYCYNNNTNKIRFNNNGNNTSTRHWHNNSDNGRNNYNDGHYMEIIFNEIITEINEMLHKYTIHVHYESINLHTSAHIPRTVYTLWITLTSLTSNHNCYHLSSATVFERKINMNYKH